MVDGFSARRLSLERLPHHLPVEGARVGDLGGAPPHLAGGGPPCATSFDRRRNSATQTNSTPAWRVGRPAEHHLRVSPLVISEPPRADRGDSDPANGTSLGSCWLW